MNYIFKNPLFKKASNKHKIQHSDFLLAGEVRQRDGTGRCLRAASTVLVMIYVLGWVVCSWVFFFIILHDLHHIFLIYINITFVYLKSRGLDWSPILLLISCAAMGKLFRPLWAVASFSKNRNIIMYLLGLFFIIKKLLWFL